MALALALAQDTWEHAAPEKTGDGCSSPAALRCNASSNPREPGF